MVTNMTLDDIPPDLVLILTAEFDRLFKSVKCNPTCHGCNKAIKIGAKFQLVTHKRVIDILEPTSKTIDALRKLNLPSGVYVELK